MIPLFVCHANCCRSVLAQHLYRHLCSDKPALSAGFEPGERINDRAEAMLRNWGIDPGRHEPRRLSREMCEEATAIFIMGPSYLHRLLCDYGEDLARKAYLFADPFTKPVAFNRGEYKVYDPSFDDRPTEELVKEYAWMRERVLQIYLTLLGAGHTFVPAEEYVELWRGVDPRSH